MLFAIFLLQAAPPAYTAPIPEDSVRFRDRPVHVAPGGTRSELLPPGAKNDTVSVATIVGGARSVRITVTWDDAGGCGAPHSVVHRIAADTLTVVTYDDLPTICPSVYTPRDHSVLVTGLPPGAYVVRYFAEGRGGRHGPGDEWGPAVTGRILVKDRTR